MLLNKRNIIYSFIVGLTSFLALCANAQNLGEYVYPFENNRLFEFNDYTWSENHKVLSNLFPEETYPNLRFKLSHEKISLGGTHKTFQATYNDIPIEQAFVKFHLNKNKQIVLVQSNLPSKPLWIDLKFQHSAYKKNVTYILHNNQFVLANTEQVIDEKTDSYSQRFHLDQEEYFENELKYHRDTIAYARVFMPDPLTSSGMTYGGSYKDGFTFDTTALVIQTINNPGGNTITANSTTYNFDGQTFSVSTESYVNNSTAPVLHQVFETIFLDGQGSILGFNTAITDDLSSYTTAINIEDYNYPELEQEQVWGSMPVDYSTGTFNLSNDFFIITEFSLPFTNPSTSLNDSFDFNRSQIEFEDANTFYHLNNFKLYWESLGFTDLAQEVIQVDAHGNGGADNSFFTPTSPPRLVFGQGGVDDAEDADVIIHEYGHAISAFASPGTNVDQERRALDEGFGDYLATTYSKQFGTTHANDVFSWDGHNEFWSGRISNSNKTKLDVSNGESIYFNGEVWSTTLNDLYNLLGATIADKLAIEVMYYNMPNTSLSQAALNLFVADTAIFNGIHSCQIFDVLFARKFLLGTCNDFYSGIRDTYSTNQIVQVLNTFGFTNANEALELEFSNSDYLNSDARLIGMNGMLIDQRNIQSKHEQLDYPDLPRGIYFLEIRTETNLYRFKLMKK